MQQESFCSSCGQSLPSTTTSKASYPSPQEEIAHINRETKRLEEQILRLNAKKATLLGRLNLLASSTKDIPPETLAIIFNHACTPRPGLDRGHPYLPDKTVQKRYPAVCLGAVCSQWRRVAWSTPELWTAVVFDITLNRTRTIAMLLQLYLDNVGNLLLSLNLRRLDSDRDSPHARNVIDVATLLQPILNVLLDSRNMAKIKSLRLGGELSHWVGHITGEYTRLTALALDDMKAYGSLVQVNSIPSVCQFSLYNYEGFVPILAATENITIVDFDSTPMHLCIRTLLQCPNVIECYCRLSRNTHDRDPILVPELIGSASVTFARLEILSWTLSGHPWNEALIHRLCLPNLRRLDLYERPNGSASPAPSRRALARFFSQLPSTLAAVNLNHGFEEWTQADITRYLSSMGHVRSMTLRDCEHSFAQSVVRVLTSETVDDGMALLPHLRELSMERHSRRLVDDLVTLLSRRRDWRETGTFHLKLGALRENVDGYRERLEKAAERDGYVAEYFDLWDDSEEEEF